MPPLLVETVRTLDGLVALEPAWQALYADCPFATPFQSPGWLIPLWKHLPAGQLLVWTARSQGVLVGIVPLLKENGIVSLMGAGITDYKDVLIRPGKFEEIRAAIESSLAGLHCEFDCVRWNSPLLRLCHGWTETETSPVVELPAETSEYDDAALSRHLARNLRHAAKQLRKLGDVQITLADRETVNRSLGQLIQLHDQRWNLRQSSGVFAMPRIREFHQNAVQGLVEANHLRLYTLTLNEEAIAALYVLADERAAYYYIGGFSPSFSRFSPGSLLILHAIHDAIRSGETEFHFLRGSESYKYQWAAQDRPLFRVRVA